MRLLAIDTATDVCAVGVAAPGMPDVVRAEVVGRAHAERLMVMVAEAVAAAGIAAADLDRIAVVVGPGSFTGLRIGVSTVKGLGWALGLPIAAVPTLDAMAAAVPAPALPVCPVIAARRGEVYASLYRRDGDGLRREWDYLALAPEALAERLTEPTLLVGDGAAGVVSPHARRLPPPQRVPSPACVAVLGRARLRLGETVDAAALVPFYLRASQAELRRRAAALG
jgi:tRNA threonylcarbamoyladenosine biosynthesis protein TsaB